MPLNFRKDSRAIRSYGVLVSLVLVSLLLLGLYAREGEEGPMHTLQSGASAVFAPAKFAGGAVNAMEYAAFTKVSDIAASEASVSQLKEQNDQLRQTVAQLEEYRQESERLQQLLGYRDAYALEGVVSTVVSRSGKSWSNMITIGKGTSDGVRPGLPVVGLAGVVGQVVSADAHTADIRLLQDPKSGVAVLIQSSRAEGIVKGSLNGELYLENIPDDADVKEGDIVVTSGLGGVFNRGLIVGTVARVEGGSGGPARKIVIEPNESVGALQEVMVITGMGSEGAASSDGTPPQQEDGAAEDSAQGEGTAQEAAGY